VARPTTCVVCGNFLDDDARLVLVRGRVREQHCSERCLQDNVRRRRKAEAAASRRRLLLLSLLVAGAAGGHTLWRRFPAPSRQSISFGWLDERPETPPAPPPIYFGPAWPPTDEDWTFAFAHDMSWIYPLPGPVRRPMKIDARIFGPEPAKAPRALCREEGRCGVDLGGQLWGEHVYAASDGVVDRVQAWGGDGRGGHYVRVAHLGGMAFTQYFHLAAVPRGLGRGAHVHAGDVIGLLGDTGADGAPRHLCFTLSVRPSSDFPEVYWDPQPLMAAWPLRVPSRGTVAGFAAPPAPTVARAARAELKR